MLFNSLEFLIFFPIVTISYFILPSKFRWILLLAASYIFYMFWNPVYILLIIGSTLIDYLAGLMMSKYPMGDVKRKLFLTLSLTSNLGVLFLFKYFNFFADIWSNITTNNYDALTLLLPMGISFYTFQTLSYSIDVYRGEKEVERHLGYFALYVSFFPQLVAGPIERSTRLIPQLKAEHKYDYARTVDGLKRMTWGFFKKVVIADNLAIAVNHVYGDVENMSGLTLLIATIFFAFQIYNDFSGYSDIAIGTAKIMGIDLMENFKQPYFSTSIREFWSRWHISLSTWFRDYVYIPLGGSRVSTWRTLLNVFIVFTISGLWHGAAMTFVVWGMLHGLYYIYEVLTQPLRQKLWQTIKLDGTHFQITVKWMLTMTFVLITWIFFRAESISDAITVLRAIGQIFSNINIIESLIDIGLTQSRLLIVSSAIIFNIIHDSYSFNHKKSKVKSLNTILILSFIILLFGQIVDTTSEFIYFQF